MTLIVAPNLYKSWIVSAQYRCVLGSCVTVLLLLAGGLCGQSSLAELNPAAPADDLRLQAELANIRALPFGYWAVCENSDLKLRSARSATFIIRNSQVCLVVRQSRGAAMLQVGSWLLCSNDPNTPSTGQAGPVSRCRGLNIQR